MGSYLWVCDPLDLEPSWIRRRMIRVLNTGEVGKQGDDAFSVARLAAIVIRGGNCFPFFGLQRLNRPADSEF